MHKNIFLKKYFCAKNRKREKPIDKIKKRVYNKTIDNGKEHTIKIKRKCDLNVNKLKIGSRYIWQTH